jgi:hypothetical protein
MTESIAAAFGIIWMAWVALGLLIPQLAEWRARNLRAWAGATRSTYASLRVVWKDHWTLYRDLRDQPEKV